MNPDPTKFFLTLLTPVIAAGSGWLAAAAAKYGVHLDSAGINALGVAGATAGGAALLKLIHDLEKRKSVAAVVGQARKDAQTVATLAGAADPQAGVQLEDLIAQGQRALEAKFQELAGQIQPPAAAAPVAPVAPAPDPAPVAPPPAA